ncbi:MAG: SulP family inorganic anion transporter, partial [Sphingobacteriia bacterium]
ELYAQGSGNIVSGLLGGIPITSVVVRSSANVNAGAKSKVSAIAHGLLLLVCALLIPQILNKIPIATLAAVLVLTGYKLISLPIIREFFKKGWDQFIPFSVTIVAIMFTDLLVGIVVGIIVGLFFLIRSNFRSSILVANDKNNYLIRLRKDVSFLNKPIIKAKMEALPDGCFVIVDATRADFIDKDIIEEINGFIENAPSRNIRVEVKKSLHKPMHLLFTKTKSIYE